MAQDLDVVTVVSMVIDRVDAEWEVGVEEVGLHKILKFISTSNGLLLQAMVHGVDGEVMDQQHRLHHRLLEQKGDLHRQRNLRLHRWPILGRCLRRWVSGPRGRVKDHRLRQEWLLLVFRAPRGR